MKFTFITTWLLCSLLPVQLLAQDSPSPLLLIYDASGSMWGQIDGKSKKEIASEVLTRTVSGLPDNQNIGLIAYGHRSKGDCRDVEFLVGLDNSSRDRVIEAVKGINPLGKTPLAYSATLAINSLRESKTRATIILVTDGIEVCDGDICDVVAKAKAEGIDFKLHIVGFGLKEGETDQLECAASAGDGRYYDATDAGGLSEVLQEATAQTVDDPDGNFSVFAIKNGEPVDAWVKAYKADTRDDVDAARTYRDTAWVYLPAGTYDLDVVPLEGTDIPGTTITVAIADGETKHETVSFDGGVFEVSTTNNGEGWDAIVKFYDHRSGKVAASSRTYGRTDKVELPAGYYRVTFEALVLEGLGIQHEIDSALIVSNTTTPINHEFASGIAMIGVQTTGGELIDATVNFTEVNSGKNVAAARTYTSPKNNPKKFLLSPGTYDVKILTLGAHKGNKDTLRVTVVQGETVEVIKEY